jgi:hypothetical protein
LKTKIEVKIVFSRSHNGSEYQIPFSPKKIGNIKIAGIKNIICLVIFKKSAGSTLPIA